MNDFIWQILLISPIVIFFLLGWFFFLGFFFFGFFFKPQIKLAELEFCFAFCSLILNGNLVIIPEDVEQRGA